VTILDRQPVHNSTCIESCSIRTFLQVCIIVFVLGTSALLLFSVDDFFSWFSMPSTCCLAVIMLSLLTVHMPEIVCTCISWQATFSIPFDSVSDKLKIDA
jgi:hypothetical protein